MLFFSRLLSAAMPPEPPKPLLFRVRSPSGAPGSVEVRAEWAPSGRVLTREIITADGLCLLPWLTDASAVKLRVRSAHGTGRVAVGLKDTRDGAVLEVELEDRPSLPG